MKYLLNSFLLLSLMFFITACGGGDNRQDPYIMGHKTTQKPKAYTISNKQKESAVTIATIEAESKKEIAKINKERDLELKKMEENTKLKTLAKTNELAVKEHNLSTAIHESEYAFKNSTLIIMALILTVLLALAFYMFKKNREDKLKMHEDKMQTEMYIREKELQVKMAEKILDTIASGKLSDTKEKHLLEALDKTTPTLLEK